MPELIRDTPTLRPDEFTRIQRLAHGRFGLWLRDGKQELVRTRLAKELRRLGADSFSEYADLLEADTSGDLEEQFTNLLTTNHTHFFREPAHFRFLEETVLPQLAARPQLRVWCAAAATGEEPYTLAICLLRFRAANGFPRGNPPGQPLVEASDISTRALRVASQGIYDEARFQGVSPSELRPYLLKGTGPNSGSYRIRKEVREQVRFHVVNLLETPPFTQPFPAIFCRNVMIYFDRETQTRLVQRLGNLLEPGGYLFVGHSESLNGMEHGLHYVQPAIYRKAGRYPERDDHQDGTGGGRWRNNLS